AELRAAHRWEERVVIEPSSFFQPHREHSSGFLTQRRTALFTALALAANVGSGSQLDIASAEIDDLRHAKPGLQRQAKDAVVASAGPGVSIRSGQEGVHLGAIEELHRSPLVALAGHRQ